MKQWILTVWARITKDSGAILAVLAFLLSVPTAWASIRSVELANASIELASSAQAAQIRSDLISRQPNVEIEHPGAGIIHFKNYGPGIARIYFTRWYFEHSSEEVADDAGNSQVNASQIAGSKWAFFEIGNGLEDSSGIYLPAYFDIVAKSIPEAAQILGGKPIFNFGPVGLILPGEGRIIYRIPDLTGMEEVNAFGDVFVRTNVQLCITDITGETMQSIVKGDMAANDVIPCPNPPAA